MAAVAVVATLAFGGSTAAQAVERSVAGGGAHSAADKDTSSIAQPYVAADGVTAVDIAGTKPKAADQSLLGWPTPTNRTYHLLSSCQPYASAIRRGAAAWNGLTESSYGGTPVECRNSYITDCGGGGRIVGCNWGRGQRIALFPGGVGDDALLAAHEFGHDWYGHSSYRCAGWSSPAHVMAPSICNYSQGEPKLARID